MAGRPIEIGEHGRRVAAEVLRRRTRRGWDQARLAERVTALGRRLTPSIIGKIEGGTRRVDADDLAVLALALGARVGELLGVDEPDDAQAAPGRSDGAGPLQRAVRDDLESLGDLEGMGPTLAELALTLARQIDAGGGDGLSVLPSLSRELRAAVSDLMGVAGDDEDDDGLGDLTDPE